MIVPLVSLAAIESRHREQRERPFSVTTGLPLWDPRPSYWIATVYLGFLGTALSFPVYLIVIRSIGPARAAYSGIIIPIVAMGFSTILEGYRWTPEAIAGSVLAVIGLYFAMRARKPA